METPISDIYRYAFRKYLYTQGSNWDGWAAENNFIAIYKHLLQNADPFHRKEELILFIESFKNLTAFQQGMRRYYLGLGLTGYKKDRRLNKQQHRFTNIMNAIGKELPIIRIKIKTSPEKEKYRAYHEGAQEILGLKHPLKAMPFHYLRQDFLTVIPILSGHEDPMRKAMEDAAMMLTYYKKRTSLNKINIDTTGLRERIQAPSSAAVFIEDLLCHGY